MEVASTLTPLPPPNAAASYAENRLELRKGADLQYNPEEDQMGENARVEEQKIISKHVFL